MNEPELSQGSEGEWVTYLQQLLEQAGYLTGSVDGDFGSATDSSQTVSFHAAVDDPYDEGRAGHHPSIAVIVHVRRSYANRHSDRRR